MQNPINISRGPQFHNGKAVFPFFIFFAVFIAALYCLFHALWLFFFGSVAVAILLGSYILDIQGVEIILSRRLYREYKKNVFGITGEWKSWKDYDRLVLNRENYQIETKSYYSEGQGVTLENHHQFLIQLYSSKKDAYILIQAKPDYAEAQTYARELAAQLDLPFENFFKKQFDNRSYR